MTTRNLPFTDNVESGLNDWTGSGLWHLSRGFLEFRQSCLGMQ